MLPLFPDPLPYLTGLADPCRENRNKLHPLHDVLMMVLFTVLSGMENWVGLSWTYHQCNRAMYFYIDGSKSYV
jgi:hypothetical protein